MAKYEWSGGINDNVLLEVIACRGGMTDQPNGLIIKRNDNPGASFITIDANERFMVNLLIDGVSVAGLSGKEVVKRAWEIK